MSKLRENDLPTSQPTSAPSVTPSEWYICEACILGPVVLFGAIVATTLVVRSIYQITHGCPAWSNDLHESLPINFENNHNSPLLGSIDGESSL